ncbi:MAG: hypothetical protein ISN29_06545 [Gammaproteobacteria bacterium AqS3]|nr:hypothetical protein [Gammaproteobacteria bacterium AqS3]
MSESASISYFGEDSGHDNTIVLRSDSKIIVNQNDRYTGNRNVAEIREAYPEIDCLFTQSMHQRARILTTFFKLSMKALKEPAYSVA